METHLTKRKPLEYKNVLLCPPLSPLKIFVENTKGVIPFECGRRPIVKPPFRLLAEKNSGMMTERTARAKKNPYTHAHTHTHTHKHTLNTHTPHHTINTYTH